MTDYSKNAYAHQKLVECSHCNKRFVGVFGKTICDNCGWVDVPFNCHRCKRKDKTRRQDLKEDTLCYACRRFDYEEEERKKLGMSRAEYDSHQAYISHMNDMQRGCQ